MAGAAAHTGTQSATRTKLSASERLELLCDSGTFKPIRSAVGAISPTASTRPGDGVIGGLGLVNGRGVACYAQDVGHLAGALGVAHGSTIKSVLDLATSAGIPVIAFIESGGARLQEGTAALAAYAEIFRRNVELSSAVPQISVIGGLSAGGGCYSPALTDFLVMTKAAAMFLTGPNVVREATGEHVTNDDLGGHRIHSRNGVCEFVTEDDRSAVSLVRDLLAYLPAHIGGPSPIVACARPEYADPAVALPRSTRQVYDMRAVIGGIVDAESFLEVRQKWARNVVTGFARLEGRPIGLIANQPRHAGGVLDVEGSQKAAAFVEQCDRFGIPMVVLVDTPGFMPGRNQESAGVIRFGAMLVRAFAEAVVPRVTVVVRKAFGGAYIAMNSKGLGASMVFGWPGAEVGIMSGDSAVSILSRRELEVAEDAGNLRSALSRRYREEHLSAQNAASGGFIDEVVAPSETRTRLIWTLDALAGDRSAGVM